MMQMFKGNRDSDSIRRNSFDIPIIAQWIRINPTRWNNRISMRVEVYGCEYGEFLNYFNPPCFLVVRVSHNYFYISFSSV